MELITNLFSKLPIGKARYGIMLRDDGLVMDDGTTWRLSETEYFMTTTTANALYHQQTACAMLEPARKPEQGLPSTCKRAEHKKKSGQSSS